MGALSSRQTHANIDHVDSAVAGRVCFKNRAPVAVEPWCHDPPSRHGTLISFLRTLTPLCFDRFEAFVSGSKFRAVRANDLKEGQSRRARVSRIARHRHSLSGRNGLIRPTADGEIQAAGKLDRPLHDVTRRVGGVHRHHRVRVDEPEGGHGTCDRDGSTAVVDRRKRVMGVCRNRGQEQCRAGENRCCRFIARLPLWRTPWDVRNLRTVKSPGPAPSSRPSSAPRVPAKPRDLPALR